ncbi:MAG TPA: peptidoglycan-binding domain-containing protein [Gammaproteobacteria bacterium]|nr:peptidoglycan-binding domain-containing protein [Gammaproteobacteria bacterium]
MKLRHVLTAGLFALGLACTPPALAASGTSGSNTTQPSASQVLNHGKYRGYSEAQMKALQKALSGKGYKVTASGQWDRPTRDAIEKFQKDQHLKVTGNPNAETRKALGLDW